MNRFDTLINEYLHENKEIALEKIGIIKITGYSGSEAPAAIEFTYNAKTTTSPGLIDHIVAKENKNKHLIASDIESYLSQVREFLNIGKSYEINNAGFIKSNKRGGYEFIPYSETAKPLKTSASSSGKQQTRNTNRSIIQLFTFLIVIVILAGLGWQVYQFFIQSKTKNNASMNAEITADTTASVIGPADTTAAIADSSKINTDSSVANVSQSFSTGANDTMNVRYIFETTASALRARTRTAQLRNFGNNAGYDSFTNNLTKYYNLYIIVPTKLPDTALIKDSLATFLQRSIKVSVPSANQP